MSEHRHRNLHRDLNEHLYNERSEDGSFHMRPQRGNSGENIINNFKPERRFDAIKNFYDINSFKYGDAKFDFYRNNNMLRFWRPWNNHSK